MAFSKVHDYGPAKRLFVESDGAVTLWDVSTAYKIPYTTLKNLAVEEKWTAQRSVFHRKVEQEYFRMAVKREAKRRLVLTQEIGRLAEASIRAVLEPEGGLRDGVKVKLTDVSSVLETYNKYIQAVSPEEKQGERHTTIINIQQNTAVLQNAKGQPKEDAQRSLLEIVAERQAVPQEEIERLKALAEEEARGEG